MAAAAELGDDGVTVRLTHPHRTVCPRLGAAGSKRHLVGYYAAMARGPMLEALSDRPTHLQRFPDGVDGDEVYQKRVPRGHPDHIETCRVTFPSGRTADVLRITHPAALVWAAQRGAVNSHQWPVRYADREH